MYKQILDYEEEVTPKSPAHLFCDVCGKPIGEMHSEILLCNKSHNGQWITKTLYCSTQRSVKRR